MCNFRLFRRILLRVEQGAQFFDVISRVAAFSERNGRNISADKTDEAAKAVSKVERTVFFDGTAGRRRIKRLGRAVSVADEETIASRSERRESDQRKRERDAVSAFFGGKKSRYFFAVGGEAGSDLF